jgi:hypothetical protein
MKKYILGTALGLICILAVICWRYNSIGHTKDVQYDYGTPKIYTLAEVESAGNLVIKDFETCGGFDGGRLITLSYDEERSGLEDNEEMIVFLAYFKTGYFFDGNDFNANSYEECWWYLVRKDSESEWEIQTKGVP